MLLSFSGNLTQGDRIGLIAAPRIASVWMVIAKEFASALSALGSVKDITGKSESCNRGNEFSVDARESLIGKHCRFGIVFEVDELVGCSPNSEGK